MTPETIVSNNVEQLIDLYLTEKIVKGQFLSGKQVAALSPKQHIFVDGKHAVVVAVNVDFKKKSAELIYVKGRKAFGKEQYLDVAFTNKETFVQFGVPDRD